jgi:hypothetical protein
MASVGLEPGAPDTHIALVDGYAGLCKAWSCEIKNDPAPGSYPPSRFGLGFARGPSTSSS